MCVCVREWEQVHLPFCANEALTRAEEAEGVCVEGFNAFMHIELVA